MFDPCATDSDSDGTVDCNDGCPNDPAKIAAGNCGCGVPETDSDGDNTPDCNDDCPNDPAKIVPGICGCGVADIDDDGDGTMNCTDDCPADPNKIAPGQCGCGFTDLDSDADGIDDFAEIEVGLDPRQALSLRTGVVSRLPLPGTALDLVVEGNTAYVVFGEAVLAIVDVSEFDNPILLGVLDLAER